jgi:hypothetical protein
MNQPAANLAGDALLATAPGADQLVINLCSSTTPMSLVRPAFKELERFTFFVSRRREDGRERFRLHMGYFATRAEAEQLLTIVRSVYPGAWVSEAPGKKLRGNNAAGPAVEEPASAAVAGAAAVSANPAATGLHRALPSVDETLPVADDLSTSAVRGVAPEVVQIQRPSAPPPVLSPPKPANSQPAKSASAPAPAPVNPSPAAPADMPATARDLSDSQVMRILERGPAATPPDAQLYSDVPMLHKLDEHSLHALRKDLSKNLPVPFAVQLEWSPTPIDIRSIPPLAIFRAYTLYTVGCQFEGRRWYGLRLGFFSDVLSAKQVAQYVRAEFKSVAVVPVSNRERSQADATGGIDVDKTSPVRHAAESKGDEIKLLPTAEPGSKPAAAVKAVAQPAPKAVAQPAAVAAKPAVAPARVLQRGAARSGANRTLEETLEILGASQLSIDNGRGERVNLPGRRAAAKAGTSTFSKLLDKLADRLRT